MSDAPSSQTSLTLDTRAFVALTAGEEFKEIQPISFLADFLRDLKKPEVIEAIAATTPDFDKDAYFSALSSVERMQSELSGLVNGSKDDDVRTLERSYDRQDPGENGGLSFHVFDGSYTGSL